MASLQIGTENITSTARIEALIMTIISHKGEVKLTLSWPAAGYYHRNLLQALFLPPESHKLYNISESNTDNQQLLKTQNCSAVQIIR